MAFSPPAPTIKPPALLLSGVVDPLPPVWLGGVVVPMLVVYAIPVPVEVRKTDRVKQTPSNSSTDTRSAPSRDDATETGDPLLSWNVDGPPYAPSPAAAALLFYGFRPALRARTAGKTRATTTRSAYRRAGRRAVEKSSTGKRTRACRNNETMVIALFRGCNGVFFVVGQTHSPRRRRYPPQGG